ncbi:hypothetical protein AOA12_16155 [Microbacterium sp. No. 7]|nr:hypothetical protein AOA12_16155 [Microbacterium sp. No. 7]
MFRGGAVGDALAAIRVRAHGGHDAVASVETLAWGETALARVYVRGVPEMTMSTARSGGGRLILVAEGTLLLEPSNEVGPRRFAYVPPGGEVRYRASGSVALISVELSGLFRAELEPSISFQSPVDDSGDGFALVVAVVNTLFVNRGLVSGASRIALERALCLIAGGVVPHYRGSLPAGRARDIIERANEIIASEYGDPGLTPQVIATRLGISTEHLRKTFRAIDSTPFEAIRRERLRAVERSRAAFRDLDLSTHVRLAGFTNLKAYHRASAAQRSRRRRHPESV